LPVIRMESGSQLEELPYPFDNLSEIISFA